MSGSLNVQGFTRLMNGQAAVVQGKSDRPINLNPGSPLRAVLEAFASVALWLQGLILQVLAISRLSTSTGTDADTWVGDFGLARIPATEATASVTFSRYTTTAAALVPVGGLVGSATASYAVVADTTNTAYSALAGGYWIEIGAASVSVKVQAVVPGASGNAAAGTITAISSAMPGVDTCTNAAAASGGADAEADDALRVRFRAFVNTRSRATIAAVAYAISSVQTALAFAISENVTFAGAYAPGHFIAWVDDGTGAPGAGVTDAVSLAIESVRPLTVTYEVHGPTVVTANVAVTVTAAAGYVHGDLVGHVAAAISAYIATLGMGDALAWSRLIAIAYGASEGVAAVSGVTINGGTADVGGAVSERVRAGTVVVS